MRDVTRLRSRALAALKRLADRPPAGVVAGSPAVVDLRVGPSPAVEEARDRVVEAARAHIETYPDASSYWRLEDAVRALAALDRVQGHADPERRAT